MTYLRIRKFWDYQNADAWKKALANKRGPKHPQWCKLYAYRDEDLDALDVTTRLVWYELLRLATLTANAIPNESERIAKQISMETEAVTNAISTLLKGAWIQETRTSRFSRKFLETKPPKNREVRSKKPPTPFSLSRETNGKATCPECGVGLIAPLAEHLERFHGGHAA